MILKALSEAVVTKVKAMVTMRKMMEVMTTKREKRGRKRRSRILTPTECSSGISTSLVQWCTLTWILQTLVVRTILQGQSHGHLPRPG